MQYSAKKIALLSVAIIILALSLLACQTVQPSPIQGVSTLTVIPRVVATSTATSPGVPRIAFTSHYSLSVINADGTNLVHLTRIGAMEPAWSPDSDRIAFFSGSGVDLINADGTNRVHLADIDYLFTRPAWSPNGHQLALSSGHGAGNGDLYIVDVQQALQQGSSKALRRLVYLVDANDLAWSPDGKKIAFDFQSTIDDPFKIALLAPDSPEQSSAYLLTVEGSSPAWSPNGKRLAFTSLRDGSMQLYVMNADSSNPTRLTSGSASAQYPLWSPDGQQILFLSASSQNVELDVMNADGSHRTRLMSGNVRSPAWSPNGKQILFVSGNYPNLELDVINADGTNLHQLTKPIDEWPPVWAP